MDQDACTAEERKMLTNDDHVFTISHANLKTFTGDQAHAQSGKILKSIGFETKFPPILASRLSVSGILGLYIEVDPVVHEPCIPVTVWRVWRNAMPSPPLVLCV